MLKRVLIFLSVVALAACGGENSEETGDAKNESTKTQLEERINNLMDIGQNEKLIATIKTNMGDIEIKLFPNEVPKTVKNFVGLAEKDYYNGVIFHRVIEGFMIQGGDPSGTGSGGSSYYGGTFEDEFSQKLRHDSPGVVSMANRGPNTNTSQFFITLKATPWLDGKHSVFGEVVNGMDVVRKIEKVETNDKDRPVNDVVMNDIVIEKRSN